MSKKLSVWIFIFTLTSLACGVQTSIPVDPAPAKIVQALPTVGQVTPEVGRMTVCNSGGLNVRRGAGTDNQVVGTIPDGTIVTLTGREEVPVITTWYEVQAGELVGWVFGRYLCLEAN